MLCIDVSSTTGMSLCSMTARSRASLAAYSSGAKGSSAFSPFSRTRKSGRVSAMAVSNLTIAPAYRAMISRTRTTAGAATPSLQAIVTLGPRVLAGNASVALAMKWARCDLARPGGRNLMPVSASMPKPTLPPVRAGRFPCGSRPGTP